MRKMTSFGSIHLLHRTEPPAENGSTTRQRNMQWQYIRIRPKNHASRLNAYENQDGCEDSPAFPTCSFRFKTQMHCNMPSGNKTGARTALPSSLCQSAAWKSLAPRQTSTHLCTQGKHSCLRNSGRSEPSFEKLGSLPCGFYCSNRPRLTSPYLARRRP